MRFVIIFIFFIRFTQIFSQNLTNEQDIFAILDAVKKEHIENKVLDDSFSEKLFNDFVNVLDEHHYYFTKTDYDLLIKNKLLIDNQLNNKKLEFIKELFPVYNNALKRAHKNLETLRSKEFKILKTENFISYEGDSANYATNETELINRWDKYLKFQTLIQEYQVTKDSANKIVHLKSVYLKKLNKSIQKIQNLLVLGNKLEKHLNYLFAHTLTSQFDAHTSYMTFSEFQNFQSSLSTKEFMFGFLLDINEFGQIEVTRLLPGSPAWNSNKINKGDIMTHIQWENGIKTELFDVSDQELSDILSYSNSLHADFTFKSVLGVEQVVRLKKEKLKSTENIVKGYVLTDEKQNKIGYIALPSFYTEYESETILGCANDVSKELLKLQKENISGFILDLRNNGGGSIKEGMELSGLFVNEGTLAFVKDSKNQITSLKDMYRGTVYSGPMVVMVNGHSASASEFVASTLQDYNRALIVGNQTFGKATGQEMLNLDNGTEKRDSLKNGFLHLTVLKLYRLTGNSNQKIGVTPDITLPDPLINFYHKESDLENTLESDKIVKKAYYQPFPAMNISQLKTKSAERISKNLDMQKDIQLSKFDREEFYESLQEVNLTKEGVKTKFDAYSNWYKDFLLNAKNHQNKFTVKSSDVDQSVIQLSEEDKILAEEHIKTLKKDITLEETFNIMLDLINNK